MKTIKTTIRILVIAILSLLAFGSSSHTQATQSDTDQFSCTNVSQIPQIECEALVALYNETDGPNWQYTTGWLVTNTPCNWYGVTCGEKNIIWLELSGSRFNIFGLQGDVPAEIGNLNNLTYLDLTFNQLSSLPAEIGNLNKLTWLDIQSNQLSSLPTEIGTLNNLTHLDFSRNQLSKIPAGIWRLNNLTTLNLGYNQLSRIPAEIGNLNNLTTLNLSDNQLSSLPAEIGTLSNLTYLDLADTQLSRIPAEIGNLNNLTMLDLSYNQLSSLPSEIWSLNSLTDLDLWDSHLDIIPAEIGDLNNLTMLNLGDNQLSSLPPEIWSLNKLTRLTLSYNQLSNLPPEIGNLSILTWLDLRSNQLCSLPADLIKLVELGYLDVSLNCLVDISTELQIFIDKKDPNWRPIQVYPFEDAPNSTPTPTLAPTLAPTPTLTPEDDYEFDNNCASATESTTNGISHLHNFYSPGDEDWVKFTAPTAGLYRVEVDIPNGSRADVDLAYYTECDSLSVDRWVEPFTPGVRMDIEADAGETFYLKLNNFDEGVGSEDVTYDLSIRLLPPVVEDAEVRRAVIIVAGRYRLNDTLQDNINETAKFVYQLFQNQGVVADDILVLAADNDNIEGYDDKVSENNLRLAITDWSVDKLSSENGNPVKPVLNLYIIDHGDPDEIYLDKHNDQSLLTADLHQWLRELEMAVPNVLINVIIEACHSGSFIEGPDSISSEGRLIITSTSAESDAYASRKGIHFSDAFVTLLQQGRDLATSFDRASQNVRNLYSTQEPWLDADGDGIPNEFEDAIIAGERSFNDPVKMGENWPPHIFSAAIVGIAQDRSRIIQVDVRDDQLVEEVWAVLYPPGYVAPTVEHELVPEQLGTFPFIEQGKKNEFVLNLNLHACGSHRVVIHARDKNGLRASPVALMVDSDPCQFLPFISENETTE